MNLGARIAAAQARAEWLQFIEQTAAVIPEDRREQARHLLAGVKQGDKMEAFRVTIELYTEDELREIIRQVDESLGAEAEEETACH